MTGRLQVFRHRESDRLGAGKNDHPFAGDRLQHTVERFQLVAVLQRDAALTDAPGFLFLRFDRDFCRFAQVALG